jgi:hypothetical protein
LNQAAGPGEKPVAGVGKPLAEAAYWIVFLIFLPAVLEALNLKALIEPVNVMMNKFFGLIPNLVAAGVTLVVGWFVARIVQRLSASLIASSGLDGFCERWGFSAELGQRKLSEVLGLIIYVLILIPVIIAALDELRLDAVTRPASEMLGTILNKIPQLFGVALIFILAYVVGQVVGTLAMNVLRGLGFDQVLVKIGLARQPAKGPTAPAAIAGLLIQIGVMLLAAMAAAETLGFLQVATVINDFLHFASKVILGLILFGLGLMLAQVVANAISASDSPRSRILAWVARIGISVLIGAMALRATGVAESIVNLAFGALVCGLAAAGALAFGLGGRKTAAGQLEKWQADYERFVNQQSPPNP